MIAFILAECRHFLESFRNGIHALSIEFPSVYAILDQLLGRSDIVTREDRQSGSGRLIQHESPRFLKRRMNEATRASVKLREFLDLAETGEEDDGRCPWVERRRWRVEGSRKAGIRGSRIVSFFFFMQFPNNGWHGQTRTFGGNGAVEYILDSRRSTLDCPISHLPRHALGYSQTVGLAPGDQVGPQRAISEKTEVPSRVGIWRSSSGFRNATGIPSFLPTNLKCYAAAGWRVSPRAAACFSRDLRRRASLWGVSLNASFSS